MSHPDRLQQAWQSQPVGKPDINPDRLLKAARFQRRAAFWADVVVIAILVFVGILMATWALRDIHSQWPWLIYSASDVWVVGFMLFNQWSRRRHAPHFDEPLLAHVEWSIKNIGHRMVQDRRSFWWYVLPLALGCIIPSAVMFGMKYVRDSKPEDLLALLLSVGFFAAVFAFVHLAMKYGRRTTEAQRRQELDALRTLRESMLNTEE